MNNRPTALNRRTLIAAIAGVALPLAFGCSPAVARRVPAPVPATYTAPGAPQVAVLAGGCFWGIQGVYSHVKGVTQAVSGFAGGTVANPSYELVSTGRTGHAESVRITFDPAQISYGDILQIFFSVATDPTQLNRQGPDTGSNYRSAIFYHSPEQAAAARASLERLQKSEWILNGINLRWHPKVQLSNGRDFIGTLTNLNNFIKKEKIIYCCTIIISNYLGKTTS